MPSPRLIWPLATVATLAGILGIAAIWTGVAVVSGKPVGWMALVAAVDAVLLLRLAGTRPGWPRAGVAVAATAATVVLANWFIVATQLGLAMGLRPLPSALRLGPDLAWYLAVLANGGLDVAAILAALALAAWWGR
ncbi:MAG: hypothetical protein ACK4RW_08255 [Rehaibacterium terrae]|uniref:hypothetical protein n=1 Tax=Rehaibacterium terrae TaxID=1341696 RepID=UPI00391AAC2A